MFRALMLFVTVCMFTGCGSLLYLKYRNCAFINDTTSKSPCCHVIAVDGKPPERVSHPTITMLPNAVIKPGEHTITAVTEKNTKNEKTVVVTFYFESGKWYLLRYQNEQLHIVEETTESEKSHAEAEQH
jgi:hypothetical protein